MKRILILGFFIVLVIAPFAKAVPSVFAQTDYRYAYLALSSPDQAQIALVDPVAPSSVEYRALSLPADWEIPSLRVSSPNGEWVVFASAQQGEDGRLTRFVRLVNMNSGEVRDLVPGLVGELAWSPDSRYLALSQDQTGVNDLYVYSLADGSTRNLTNDSAANISLTWSPDSASIAEVSESFANPAAPVIQLEVIEVSTGSRQTSPNFASYAPINGFACNLDWSPDGQYVSFVMGCFASVEVAREVFVWDTLQARLSQVTNFTVGAYQPGGTNFSPGFFVPAWYDADTLLIGANYRTEFDQPTTEETYRYEISINQLATLYEGTTEEWVLNVNTGQMAARIVTTAVSAEAAIADGAAVTGEIEVFTLSTDSGGVSRAATLSAARTLPLGCDLAWSPDGTILAYTVRDSANCLGVVQRVVFVDGATGVVQEYTPLTATGEAPYGALPIGWVAG